MSRRKLNDFYEKMGIMASYYELLKNYKMRVMRLNASVNKTKSFNIQTMERARSS